jgi:IMP dehydrogenase/GMP reductase
VDISRSIALNDSSELELKIPIFASPMKGITGINLVSRIGAVGGLGILHRFFSSPEEHVENIHQLEKSGHPYGIAVGLGSDLIEMAPDLKGLKVICVDVANGYLKPVREYTKKVSDLTKGLPIAVMAGNIADEEGVRSLHGSGASLLRVGIGPGRLCTTRNVTGVGVPQITAISDCDIGFGSLVADGGIRNSGDIVKALAIGAAFVMLGSLFARVHESDNEGVIYGMASRKLQQEHYSIVRSVEGIEKKIDAPSISVDELLDELAWGIKSACTYVNAKNLDELAQNATFIEVGDAAIKKFEV